jgi:hypothetical protein
MKSKRTILKFIIIAALIFGVFAIRLSWTDHVYGKFYRATGELFFSHIAGNGFVRFSSTEDPDLTKINTGNIELKAPGGGYKTQAVKISTRNHGYLPTLLLFALIIASPVPIKRKLFAILAGFILIMAWIIVKQWIHILYIISENPWLDLYNLSSSKQKIVSYLYEGFVFSLTPSYSFVVIIWFLVTFRKEDLSLIRSNNS